MPKATAALHRLRVETGVKSGEWSTRVDASQSHYLNVERGRMVGSPELFQRCAAELTRALGRVVEARDLMEDGDGGQPLRHSTAGGQAPQAAEAETEAAEAAQAETRGVA